MTRMPAAWYNVSMTRAKALSPVLEAQGPFDPRSMSLADAQDELKAFYVGEHGYKSRPPLLTLPESQHKLGMSSRRAVGLTLAPADASGWDVCMWRTPACTAACVLTTAGNARYDSVRDARVVKTLALAEHPQAFVTVLDAELRAQVREHGPIDFRPNVGSDIRWERVAPALFHIRGVRVYDYTKAPASQREPEGAYSRLVYSVSEREASVERALEYLREGGNAAVVFDTKKGHALPKTWNGFRVVDADTSDSRVDDPRGRVVGLRAKGAARGVKGRPDGFVKSGEAS